MAGSDWAAAELARLPDRYREINDEAAQAHHREAAAALDDERAAVVVAGEAGAEDAADAGGAASDTPTAGRGEAGAAIAFTVITRDAPGLFSLISGLVGALGLDIQRGHIFTSPDGLVLDQFVGRLGAAVDAEGWLATLESQLARLLRGFGRDDEARTRARDDVVERVARSIAGASGEASRLLPIELTIDQDGELTRVMVVSQDTPFFLYSLATALALQDIVIRRLEIDTSGEQLTDVFWVTTRTGEPLTRERDRARLRLSILVTKQFSHALDQAADPRAAFTRFEELVRRVAIDGGASGSQLESLLANPESQQELARLLGASDFLWEDFIRLQYEELLPLLERRTSGGVSTPSDQLAAALDRHLAAADDHDARIEALNRFKDQEAFLVDADHILRRDTDFFFLSHRLTRLAEVVIAAAFRLAWADTAGRYGTPRSAAGLPSEYAVFGLGKLGGSALGYASDIELMVVYSDHGETDGGETITNREFFERLVTEVMGAIRAPREGIFRVDLRLRPYGDSGPRAVHVESFVGYFGPGGDAHSAERLALIRLRPVAGDAELGRRIVTIRDQIVYESDAIDVREIRDLRQMQLRQKVDAGRLNAKLSPGALVDLEYNVQLLQVSAGRNHPDLRDPGIHATLRGLSGLGAIDADEAESMIRAYRFLRNLINALRMLRGNAQDLYLPEFGTLEFGHLARRVGYRDNTELAAAEQLRVDFEVETAAVRGFVERHLGEEALPGTPMGTPADLVLSDAVSDERAFALVRAAGFQNPSGAIGNLRRLAGDGATRETFARLLVLGWEYFRRSSDPDLALNTWERFTRGVGERTAFFQELSAQPRRLEIMLMIFAGSRFLSDTLVREPANLQWISDPAVITRPRTEEELAGELGTLLAAEPDRTGRLNALRRFRRREILRIGARDICLAGDFEGVVREISTLARVVIEQTLYAAVEELDDEGRRRAGPVAILAFGKLGGDELNYSSDIDLLAIYQPDDEVAGREEAAARLFRQVVRDLSDFTLEGQAYRVDLKLRPWGNAGRLVYAHETLLRYYGREAELWELQALIKLNPVAGDRDAGQNFLRDAWPVFVRRMKHAGADQIRHTVRHLRARAVKEIATSVELEDVVGSDVKNGAGGIRDIEFLVQALQMLHHGLYPEIVTGNTLEALRRLEEAGILDAAAARELRGDYLFLRRIEHFLQVYEDQQLHVIPAEPGVQRKIARVVLGAPAGADQDNAAGVDARGGADDERQELISRIRAARSRVRERYLAVIGEG